MERQSGDALMDFANLGCFPLKASKVGLGCMALTGVYGEITVAQAKEVLVAAVDVGINFFDTADVYGNGENERLIGEMLRPMRNNIIIATKGGATRNQDGKQTNDGSPAYLRQACEASLKRLGVERIDLYYLHRIDRSIPIEDSVGELSRLVEEGKIAAIGLSEANVQTLRRAHLVHPISALQTEYSLACRFPEEEILPTCRELGVSFIAYSPLGRGLLSGSLSSNCEFAEDDMRRNIPRFQCENLGTNLKTAAKLRELAAELGLEPSQLALAWVMSHPAQPLVIPGTRDPVRVHNNARAAMIALPRSVIDTLDVLFAAGIIQGERHTAHMLSRTGL